MLAGSLRVAGCTKFGPFLRVYKYDDDAFAHRYGTINSVYFSM